MLKPGDQWRRQPNSGHQDQSEVSAYWQAGGLDWRHIAARLPESHAMEPQKQRAESDKQTGDKRDREPWRARECRAHDQKLAHEHAEGRQSGNGQTPMTRHQPSIGCVTVSPLMSAISCVPLTCDIWPTVKKTADFVRLCMIMCRRPAKLASGAADAKSKGNDPHVLDRRISEHSFDRCCLSSIGLECLEAFVMDFQARSFSSTLSSNGDCSP